MIKKEFSIVVPVFNRSEIVSRTLDSIKMQTYRPLHLIIVDNNSSDDSFEVCRRWAEANREPDFRITVLLEKKPWAVAARNRGLREVKSDYMCFFDSDDVMRPQLVWKAMEQFGKDSATDIVCWQVMAHPNRGKDFIMKKYRPGKDLLWEHIMHTILRPQGHAVRTSLVRSVGGWNEQLPLWDDYELGIRLLLKNPVCRYVPEILADVYPLDSGMTGTSMREKAGRWEPALDAAEEALRREGREDLCDTMDYRRMVLAGLYAREGDKKSAKNLVETVKKPSAALRMVYHYTRLGFRGAYLWWRFFRKKAKRHK